MVELAGSGDDGTTGLLGGTRTAKDDVRVEAYGTVDEASSSLGLARALTSVARVAEVVEELQRGLYRLGAELATEESAAGRFGSIEAADVARLEELMAELEAAAPMPRQFVLPGTTPGSAALDVARTVVRRAERRLVTMVGEGAAGHAEARRWLNRLSLLVFVLARYEEAQGGVAPSPARTDRPSRP